MLEPPEVHARRDHAGVRRDGIRRGGSVRRGSEQPARREPRREAGARAKEPFPFFCFLETWGQGESLGTTGVTAVDLLLEVIRDHSPVSKWTDAPLIAE